MDAPTSAIRPFSVSARSSSALPTVAVIGAGVIGLSIAWTLARAGCRVSVFDRGPVGGGASNAAGGMLAACVEAEPGEEGLVPLARASQALWPGFAVDLHAAGGIDPELRTEGTMVIARTADDLGRVRFLYDFQKGLGLPVEWLPGSEVRHREPFLVPGIGGAIFCHEDHQVDSRRLVAGLHSACVNAGVSVSAGVPVTRLNHTDGRVTGVTVGDTVVTAAVVILAAGAWSRDLPGLTDAGRPPVRPVKGQMAAVRMSAAAPLLSHVVWTPGTYLIPRRDGRLIIGATTEEAGFDERLTAGGVMALLEGAWRALPGIADLPLEETWVGFRPTARDDAPILGTGPLDGLVYATGHHRNGILLTPITAQAIAALVLDGEMPAVAAPFALSRFQPARAA